MTLTPSAPAPLPIDDALPGLLDAIRAKGCAVLVARPGAGKTTRVPLALLPVVTGRILLLEPRRLAARAAAVRMADTLGDKVGQTVGYRIRGEARISAATRIEVVTEGILTRMLQSDPGLTGIGAVIFDEFHERALVADLGLALAWDIRAALRPDLILIVMSATLDAAPVAAMLDDAPLIRSEGRAFAVDTRWLPKPVGPAARFEATIADLIATAALGTEGSILAFLPGEGEIRRTEAILKGRLPTDCRILPLYGAMPFAAQTAALTPAPPGIRHIILATSIAETSLTLPGIRVVIDGGRARRARFDPASGMSRLVTERVTKAEAEQRRGRAGRVAEGLCFRMWTRGEEGALAAFPPPEIARGDLTGLALELALWGGAQGLRFLTAPPEAALAEARALLADLGALDDTGRITDHGRQIAALPLHPRLAHMLAVAGPTAAPLAALLAERDPLRGAGADLMLRLSAIDRPGPDADRAAIDRIRAEAARLARTIPVLPVNSIRSAAECAALAYPDRIGIRRSGDAPRYVLSGGKGAVIDAADPLSRATMVVATDLDGDPREARLRVGIEIAEASVRRLFGDRIGRREIVEWSRREGRVVARSEERLGALVLSEAPLAKPDPDAVARAAFDGLRAIGLPLTDAARRFRARILLLARDGAEMPDLSDTALLASPDWLLTWLGGKRTEAELRAMDLTAALKSLLSWDQGQLADRLAPAHFTTPLGRQIAIDYEGDHPSVTLRLQEMFGVTVHPTVGPKALPLRVTLLSPAQRPVQVTTDLPGFWRTSYADVRRDMRGSYPRHPWPEDPTLAEPTLRAKPRGT